jgi:hypothetical protein
MTYPGGGPANPGGGGNGIPGGNPGGLNPGGGPDMPGGAKGMGGRAREGIPTKGDMKLTKENGHDIELTRWHHTHPTTCRHPTTWPNRKLRVQIISRLEKSMKSKKDGIFRDIR